MSTHFTLHNKSIHQLEKSSQAAFTSHLKEHLSLIIIESVKPKQGIDIEATLKEREDFWQATLKSTPLYGGLNKRSNKTKRF